MEHDTIAMLQNVVPYETLHAGFDECAMSSNSSDSYNFSLLKSFVLSSEPTKIATSCPSGAFQ